MPGSYSPVSFQNPAILGDVFTGKERTSLMSCIFVKKGKFFEIFCFSFFRSRLLKSMNSVANTVPGTGLILSKWNMNIEELIHSENSLPLRKILEW